MMVNNIKKIFYSLQNYQLSKARRCWILSDVFVVYQNFFLFGFIVIYEHIYHTLKYSYILGIKTPWLLHTLMTRIDLLLLHLGIPGSVLPVRLAHFSLWYLCQKYASLVNVGNFHFSKLI